MRTFSGLWTRLAKIVSPAHEQRYPAELAHRFRFARLMLYVVAPLFYAYAVHFIVIRIYASAGLMLFGGVMTTVSTVLYARIYKGRTATLILNLVSVSVLLTLALHEVVVVWANGRLDYITWSFLLPPLAFYLLGEKKGFYAILGSVAIVAFILFVRKPGVTQYVDVTNLKIQYGISFLSTIVGSYIYERTRTQVQKELFTKQEMLLRSENQLRESIDALQAAKAQSEQLAVQAGKENRAKSEFLAGMSHELRTPLNHIIGFTDLLLEGVGGDLTNVQREYLGDVASSGRHLLSLITDILDLSKVEAGKLEVHPERVDVRELLEHSVLMIKDRALRHGINTTVDHGDRPATVVADKRMMQQILYNLLSNAMKFTPDGGKVSLRCSAGGGEGDRGPVEIHVTDTGVGIDAGNLERIFAPFEQVDNALRDVQEGTGLGLTLTRKMIELLGGRIWVESEGLGKGSTFRVSLPVDLREDS